MGNQEYAGFWVRVGAGVIDTVFFYIITMPILLLVYGEGYWFSEALVLGFWDMFISYVMPFFITIWFWLRYFGTPGKMALRLKVVDAETGEALTSVQAIARYFGYFISLITLLLGYFWIGVDPRKQGFHDKLANTVVVRDMEKRKVRFSR